MYSKMVKSLIYHSNILMNGYLQMPLKMNLKDKVFHFKILSEIKIMVQLKNILMD